MVMALKQTNALHARCDGLQSDKEALEAQAKQENETLRQEILALKQTNAGLHACCDGLKSDSGKQQQLGLREYRLGANQ